MEILASIAIVAVTTIFIVLSFTIYLTLKIFAGKSINNKEYAPVHATIFDLFFHLGFGFHSHEPNPRISGRFRRSLRAKRPMVNDPLPQRAKPAEIAGYFVAARRG